MNMLWSYGVPCAVAVLVMAAVLSTVNTEPAGTHRAPRGYSVPPPVLDPSPVIVIRTEHGPTGPHGAWRSGDMVSAADLTPIPHVGATLETNREDYVAEPAPLDPDAPEVWLAQWAEDYRQERQRIANANPWKAFEQLYEPTPAELVMETEAQLHHVQKVCEDIAARLTSIAEAQLFDWRINTDTGQLPIIDGPAAERLAAALLEA